MDPDAPATFALLTSIAAVVAFGAASRSPRAARAMASGFLVLSWLLSASALVGTVLLVSHLVPPRGSFGPVYRVLVYRAWMVAGIGVACAILLPLRRDGPAALFASSPRVLAGLCLSVAVSFLSVEIGKLANDAEMRDFFLASGYPVWLLYLTMALETAGAIGLLLARTRVAAALGLCGILLGAIFTHLRNGDPWSDSMEAIHLLVVLLCIVAIRFSARHCGLHRTAGTTVNPTNKL
jgi:uncharacterized membrane protein YphA (DoxX/SURF4 family)